MATRHPTILVLALCSTASGSLAAVATTVERGAIQVDGRLDEPGWAAAEVYRLSHSLTKEEPTASTRFRVLCDGQAAYFGVVCEQENMAGLRAERRERDSNVWGDDCVEIFVDPAGKGEEYFQFIVNARGTFFDARYLGGRNQDAKWNAEGVCAAGHRADRSWSLEVMLPLRNFAMPQAKSLTSQAVSASSWRINVGREYKGGRPHLLTFVPLGSFFQPEKFAPLTGIRADYERFRWRIGPVELERVRPEGGAFVADLTAAVENLTGQFRAFGLTADAVLPDGERQHIVVTSPFGADSGQTQIIPFSVPLRQRGDLILRMHLTDRKQRELVAWCEFTVPVDVSPLVLSISKPFYRSAIYATMDVKEIEVELSALWEPELVAGDRLEVSLWNAAGEKVAGVTESDIGAFIGRHPLPIPKLAAGRYPCQARILRAGRELYHAETTLHVYGPSPSEVRVNEHLNFVINGRETFLVGFFHTPWRYSSLSRCNAAITYSVAHDLDQKPEVGERLSQLGSESRAMMVFPHPKSVWTHQVGGRVHLAGKPLRPDHAALIGERVAQYSRQPGLLGWYMADEPSPHMFLPAYLERLAETIRANDPYHPCYLSYNFGSAAAAYDAAVDACGLHYYIGFTDRGPVSPISSIAKHLALVKKAVRHRKAVLYSPQLIIFSHQGDPDIRPVRHVESRCMAYLAIVRGAKGIVWFSVGGVKSSLEIRIGIPVLIDELRQLEDVFLAHEECDVRVTGPGRDAVHTLGKRIDDQLYVIAVNAEPDSAEATLHLPANWRASSKIMELDAGPRPHACASGQLLVRLEPYEVCVFTTDPHAPRLLSKEELSRRFEAQDREFMATGNLCYQGRGARVQASDDYGLVGKARLVIDGYKDYSYECLRHAKEGSWVQVFLPAPETVVRIEVSSNSLAKRGFGRGRLREYELAVFTGDRWEKVEGAVREETDDDVFTRIHATPPTHTNTIRLTMSADAQQVGCVNEIQAFAAPE